MDLRMSSTMPSKQTLMFCIGAQKAGTTWLERQLASQSDVYFAKPKELHYWDCIRSPYLEQYHIRAEQRLHVPQPGDPLRYRLSRLWHKELRDKISLARKFSDIYNSAPYDHSKYLAYLGLNRNTARLIGDITPSYALLSRTTYKEMFDCSSDTRFVFMMRDPVRRLWSGLHQKYRRELKHGAISSDDLNRRFVEICNDQLDPNFQRSNYVQTINELEALVPASHIHYCFYETLLDPIKGEEERESLAGFLGVSSACLNAEEKIHAAKHSAILGNTLQKHALSQMDAIYSGISKKFEARFPQSWGE